MKKQIHYPIVFIFDTNAFSYLADDKHFEYVLEKIRNQNDTVFPLFSLINFYEYLKGINNDSILRKRQNYMKAIKKITVGGSIFLNPTSHVQYFTNQITTDQAKNEADFFIKMINLFLSLKNYRDYEDSFKELLKDVNSRIEEIIAGYKSMRDILVGTKRGYSKDGLKDVFKNRFSKSPLKEDYEILAPNIISRFKLKLDLKNKDISIELSKYPSINYFIDVYWKYIGQLIFNEREPAWGDYFDLEQMVYLNIADYFVTNENRVRLWINENHNPELRGRALSPEKFINILDNSIIEKKAKQNFSLEWLSLK